MTEEEGAPLDIKFQQRFSKNLISNVVYFVLNVIIGLALVPFFLDTLGPAAYALVPLATSITSYISVILDSINSSVSRYLTIDLQRANMTSANQTYNSSIFGMLLVLVILVPVSVIVAGLSPSLFDIGESAAADVFLLFLFVFASVLIRAFSSCFMVTLFAYNRMDLRNYVNIFYQILQIVLIILLFAVFGPSLVFIGISYASAAVVSLILSFILSRNICPTLTISISSFSKSRFKEIGGLTFWALLERIGSLLQMNLALIAVNILYGAVAETQYSIALTWATLLYAVGGLVTSTFTPMIYSYRSKDDVGGLVKFSTFATRVTGLFMTLPIGLACIFSPLLLTLWVGEEYASLSPLVWILVIAPTINVMASCFGSINSAYLRVRYPAIFTFIMGLLNAGLIFSIDAIFDIGMYSAAFAYVICMILSSGLNTPLYIAHILKISYLTFLKPMFYGYVSLAGLLIAGLIVTSFISVDSIIMLIISGFVFSIVYLLIILKLVLKKEEKDLIRSCIPQAINKLIPKCIL